MQSDGVYFTNYPESKEKVGGDQGHCCRKRVLCLYKWVPASSVLSTTGSYFFFYLFFFFWVLPHSMWGLSSPTRDHTHALCVGSTVLTTDCQESPWASLLRSWLSAILLVLRGISSTPKKDLFLFENNRCSSQKSKQETYTSFLIRTP